MFGIIRYLMMFKGNISVVFSHKYMKIKINSDNDLPLESTLNLSFDSLATPS